ncbi:MAG: site-2 protease family protein, partial [Thermomicrobium sp.]
PFTLRWKRGADTLEARLQTDSDGKIGVQITTVYTGLRSPISYTIPQALALGARSVARVVSGFGQAVAAIVRGSLSLGESVGGPVRIAQMATEQARVGAVAFVLFVAQLSVMLAIINLLPLPALDGGHLVLVAIEALLRRELPVRVTLTIQQIGIALLAMLMLLVLWNDLRR